MSRAPTHAIPACYQPGGHCGAPRVLVADGHLPPGLLHTRRHRSRVWVVCNASGACMATTEAQGRSSTDSATGFEHTPCPHARERIVGKTSRGRLRSTCRRSVSRLITEYRSDQSRTSVPSDISVERSLAKCLARLPQEGRRCRWIPRVTKPGRTVAGRSLSAAKPLPESSGQ